MVTLGPFPSWVGEDDNLLFPRPPLRVVNYPSMTVSYLPSPEMFGPPIPPINRLPPELIGLILCHSMQEWDGNTVESLMAVCYTWSLVCVTTPSLWTQLRLNLDRWNEPGLYEKRCNYIIHHLCRSGALPMRVTINAAPAKAHPNGLREHISQAQSMLQMLFTGAGTKKGANTWEELTFIYSELTPRRVLDFLGEPMPNLHRLNLQTDKGTSLPIMQLPSLQSLERKGSPIPGGVYLQTLRSLTLDCITLSNHEISLLTRCQELSSLTLRNVECPEHLSKATIPSIIHLTIQSRERLNLRFLTLPNLKSVKCTIDLESFRAVARLRNFPEIRKLEFAEWEWFFVDKTPTKWGFMAHSTRQMNALKREVPEDALESILEKSGQMEVFEGPPRMADLLKRLMRLNPGLCPKLKWITSRERDHIISRQISQIR